MEYEPGARSLREDARLISEIVVRRLRLWSGVSAASVFAMSANSCFFPNPDCSSAYEQPSARCSEPAFEAGQSEMPTCPGPKREGTGYGYGTGLSCAYVVCIPPLSNGTCAPCGDALVFGKPTEQLARRSNEETDAESGDEDRESRDAESGNSSTGSESSESADSSEASESTSTGAEGSESSSGAGDDEEDEGDGEDGVSNELEDLNLFEYCYFELGTRFEALGLDVGVTGPYGAREFHCVPSEPKEDQCCYVADFEISWVCGRPFVVDGEVRRGRLVEARGSSMSPCSVDGDLDSREARGNLDARAHATLAAFWRDMAGAEYASVASFARFTLDLIALGAPLELVTAAQQAGLDELEHTRMCLAMVAAHERRQLEPAAMDVGSGASTPDFPTFVENLIVEGCVGESVAGALALLAARRCASVHLSQTWARIAEDELRHAQLAWATLNWLLDTRRGQVRELLRTLLPRLEPVPLPHEASRAGDSDLEAHGWLSERERRQIGASMVRDAIAPTLRRMGA